MFLHLLFLNQGPPVTFFCPIAHLLPSYLWTKAPRKLSWQSSPLRLSPCSRLFQHSASTQLIQTLSIFSWPHPISYLIVTSQDFPGGSDGKVSAYSVGDQGSIPGLGRSPGEGNGNLLQYSCLENPMDERVWQATVHGVAKRWTQLNDFTSLHRLHVSVTCPQVENLKAGVATGFALIQCQLHRR